MMNTIKRSITLMTASLLFLASCGNDDVDSRDSVNPNPPAETWKEDWFEHEQVLQLQYYNDSVAIYYDNDMRPDVTWPRRMATQIWNYTWQTYGGFGDDLRLKVILHADKYGGGHPAYYMSPSHGYNNGIDIGLDGGKWIDSVGEPFDILTHEIGHIVEGNSHSTLNSPAYAIWGDSKWMEIYQYDVYKALGWSDKAKSWHERMLDASDNFPREGTHWYRDWFYPIYNNHGQKEVLSSFFSLLSQYFPKKEGEDGLAYARDMNMGEFVHFWSGAAKSDLKQLALNAFGELDRDGSSWVTQLGKAKIDFPQLRY